MKILITGGTGTLGHALARRLSPDHDLTVLSRDPLKQKQMRQEYPAITYVLGDVRDYDSMYRSFVGHDVVIHAAANKHIPECEANVNDSLAINLIGSQNVAIAAIQANVRQVVGISTDKVCSPANVYGASKLLMERLFVEFNDVGLTQFHLCRYGNVIGSNGSVVQIWRDQIANGKIPTLTDPEMTRFWLTEDQAVDLVLLAMAADPGVVVIPRAPGLSMAEFAAAAGIDDWVVVGKRPGEKMHETLVTAEERPYCTERDGYFYLDRRQRVTANETPYASNRPGYSLDWSDLAEVLRA